jgi:SurA-like protein
MLIARTAIAVVFIALFAGCRGSDTVARVGDEKIREADVEKVVEHFEEEFQREGREFPADGTPEHHALAKNVLALIVFRVQLEQAAAKLDVRVDDEEVEARFKPAEDAEAEGQGEGAAGEAYFENVIRTQLVREKVARKLGSLEALNAWVAKARKDIAVEYEEGWARAP